MTDETGRNTHRLASRSFWLVVGVGVTATGLVSFGLITGAQWVTVQGLILGCWFGRDGVLKALGRLP